MSQLPPGVQGPSEQRDCVELERFLRTEEGTLQPYGKTDFTLAQKHKPPPLSVSSPRRKGCSSLRRLLGRNGHGRHHPDALALGEASGRLGVPRAGLEGIVVLFHFLPCWLPQSWAQRPSGTHLHPGQRILSPLCICMGPGRSQSPAAMFCLKRLFLTTRDLYFFLRLLFSIINV